MISPDVAIVLVQWRIRLGQEDRFLAHWKQHSGVSMREGLIGEFLCRTRPPLSFAATDWNIEDDPSDHQSFFTIGLWRSLEDFETQIGEVAGHHHTFEAAARRRLFFAPQEWRMGGAPLPLSDSVGVE